MNKWVIGKNSMKHHYLIKLLFTVTLIRKTLPMKITQMQKDFEIKNLREYHGLYIQSDTLLLADVFENFRNIFLTIYELHPARLLTARG